MSDSDEHDGSDRDEHRGEQARQEAARARREERAAWVRLSDEERAKLTEEREQREKKKIAEAAVKKAQGLPLSHWLETGYDLMRMKKEGFTAAELGALGADLPALVAA